MTKEVEVTTQKGYGSMDGDNIKLCRKSKDWP